MYFSAFNLRMIRIEKQFQAPISKVWDAISNKDTMKKWYFDIPDFELKLGHEFNFWAGPPDGKEWHHRCVIRVLIPEKILSHSWTYPGYAGETLVTWELIKVSDELTQVNFCHEFLVPFPEEVDELRQENFQEGWTYIINIGLKEFLELS